MLLNQAFNLMQFKSCEARTAGPAWYISAPLSEWMPAIHLQKC